MNDDDPAASIAAAAANPQPAPDMTVGNAYGPANAYDVQDVPEDCPVQPLGLLGQKFYFLDFAGQLIQLGSEFRKGELMALFGTRMRWLEDFFPQWKRAPNNAVDDDGRPVFFKDGFSQKVAQQSLIMACSKRGLFDPKGRVRGRGAHKGDNGELVMHCGNVVLVGGRKGVKNRDKGSGEYRTGLVGGYVYPTLTALPRPADEPATAAVGRQVLSLLVTWNWKNTSRVEVEGVGEVPIAAYLLFCWIAAALLGGALRIRPHGWIVGPSGAGKTTLQNLLRGLMGEWGVFTEDATEAGVRQLLDQDTLAVMFDEIEAEADNHETVMKIVRLARLAYSGASSLRGSSDHQAKQFVARSCFLFSSIHHHELPAQDRNRIAILQLSPFPPETPQFIVPELVKEWGDQLRRRLIAHWPRFEAGLDFYQREMLRQGYSGREQDTYGTLLACGDLLLHEYGAEELKAVGRANELVRALGELVDAARSEAEDTAERCVKHLASHRLPAKPGDAQETVARWVQKQIIRMANKDDLDPIRQKLGAHGMRLVHLAKDHEDTQGGLVDAFVHKHEDGKRALMWLAIANKTNKGAAEIFDGSMWKGGVWSQSLALVEGSVHNKKARFGAGGSAENCVLVPVEVIADVDAALEEAARLEAGRP
jgi:energy-coupling factor transporter ATP-binding protein EcfA2